MVRQRWEVSVFWSSLLLTKRTRHVIARVS